MKRAIRDAGTEGRSSSGLLYEVKTIVAQHPSLALPLARRRGHGEVVDGATEIVIEGYPRAASSFAVAAFRAAQQRPVRIAHHVHAPAQLVEAARRRIPALALIRDPEDALISYVIRYPDIPMRSAGRGYLRFYRPLLRLRPRLVTATFEEVVGDFGPVIRRVNERFATSFKVFEHNEENVARVFEEIDADYRTRLEEGPKFESVVPRPSELRTRLKEDLQREFRSPDFERLRTSLDSLYRRFAGPPPT
ncbi:MAG: hypothetical protein M3O84_06330 [Actinomycetota bacterium]|nr:hypothetical protein [Actinomycetota bacterium]